MKTTNPEAITTWDSNSETPYGKSIIMCDPVIGMFHWSAYVIAVNGYTTKCGYEETLAEAYKQTEKFYDEAAASQTA